MTMVAGETFYRSMVDWKLFNGTAVAREAFDGDYWV